MAYMDVMLAAVPNAAKAEYERFSIAAAEIFKDHGALSLVECWGDDVPDGKVTSMIAAVKKADDETVVASFIRWPSKEVRDKGMAAVQTDARFDPSTNPMPFDGKRMIFGGFDVLMEN